MSSDNRTLILTTLEDCGIRWYFGERILEYIPSSYNLDKLSPYDKLMHIAKTNCIRNKLNLLSVAKESQHHNGQVNFRSPPFFQGLFGLDDAKVELWSDPVISLRPEFKIKRFINIGGMHYYLWKKPNFLTNAFTIVNIEDPKIQQINLTDEEKDAFNKIIPYLEKEIYEYNKEQERIEIEKKKVFDDDFDLE